MLPTIETFEDALSAARRPRAAVVNGTVSGIDLYIGSSEIDPEQAIRIPIKYSKATMKARPPSLSKAWKPAMDLQAPLQSKTGGAPSASQLMSSIAQQSQSAHGPSAGDLAAMISADVKHHSAYVIKRPVGEEGGKETQTQASQAPNYGLEGLDEEYNEEPQEPEAEQEEEEVVAKEDIVKAWRYGSTWVPMEADTFEPLDTRKSVEVLGFFPQENVGARGRDLADGADQETPPYGRSQVHLAGSHIAQSADPVLVPRRGHASARHVRCRALGAQGSCGARRRPLRPGL
jgi:ATP-dependent DNA helicase 2 subunit 2